MYIYVYANLCAFGRSACNQSEKRGTKGVLAQNPMRKMWPGSYQRLSVAASWWHWCIRILLEEVNQHEMHMQPRLFQALKHGKCEEWCLAQTQPRQHKLLCASVSWSKSSKPTEPTLLHQGWPTCWDFARVSSHVSHAYYQDISKISDICCLESSTNWHQSDGFVQQNTL